MKNLKKTLTVKRLIELLGIEPIISVRDAIDLQWTPSWREAIGQQTREVFHAIRSGQSKLANPTAKERTGIDNLWFAKVSASLVEDPFAEKPL